MTGFRDPQRRARRLLRLYPRAWRNRYGEEFEQLLIADIDERPRSGSRTLDVFRSGSLARLAQAGLASDVLDPARQLRAGVVSIGFVAAPAHANSRGFVHGGLISALSDNAMGLSCAETLGDLTSLVTVSLAVDFLGSANLGQWVEITPKVNRAGGRLCFVEALVTADGEPCAKAHATFSVGRKPPPPS